MFHGLVVMCLLVVGLFRTLFSHVRDGGVTEGLVDLDRLRLVLPGGVLDPLGEIDGRPLAHGPPVGVAGGEGFPHLPLVLFVQALDVREGESQGIDLVDDLVLSDGARPRIHVLGPQGGFVTLGRLRSQEGEGDAVRPLPVVAHLLADGHRGDGADLTDRDDASSSVHGEVLPDGRAEGGIPAPLRKEKKDEKAQEDG